MNVNEIIKSIPMLKDVADLREYQFMNIDSNEMNPSRWIELANKMNEIVLDEKIDGVVVTHGTDTLDETAYFLTLTLNTSKPVVVTGAMRPATATSADGPYNLYQAVCLAASEDAHHQGCLLYTSSNCDKFIFLSWFCKWYCHTTLWCTSVYASSSCSLWSGSRKLDGCSMAGFSNSIRCYSFLTFL